MKKNIFNPRMGGKFAVYTGTEFHHTEENNGKGTK